MLSERKKIVLVMAMTLIALIIEATVHVGYMMSNNQKTVFISNMIYATGISRWGWLPTILLAISSIVLTLRWRLGNAIIRVIIIFISVIATILAAIWLFGLTYISHLTF